MTLAHATTVPLSQAARRLTSPVIARLMRQALSRPGLRSLAAGFTDNAVLPVELVGRATERLATAPGSPGHLQYGMNQGRPRLREAVAERLRAWPGEGDNNVGADDIVITNGSQQALYLLVQALVDPGDTVLVDDPSYFVFLELARGLGAELHPLPIVPGADGVGEQLDEAALRAWLATPAGRRCRLVYVNGYFGNPTGVNLPLAVKRALGRVLADQAQPPLVIEDAAYRELFYATPPPEPSILALAEYRQLPCAYAGTFTKPLSTGLKVGYVALARAPQVLTALLSLKSHHDFGTSHHAQAIVETILVEGWYPDHLAWVRGHYGAKMAALSDGLREAGLANRGWRWQTPQGGLLLWLEGPPGTDTRLDGPLSQAALAEEVLYVPGDLCFAAGDRTHAMRLSIGALDRPGLRDATARLARAIAAVA